VNALGMAIHTDPLRPWTEEEHEALRRSLDSVPSVQRELDAVYREVMGPSADLSFSERYERFDDSAGYW